LTSQRISPSGRLSKAKPVIIIDGHLIVPKGKPEQRYYTAYYSTTGGFSKEEKTTIGETLYGLLSNF